MIEVQMKKVVSVQYYQSPCGKLVLGSIEGELCLCDWLDIKHRIRNDSRVKRILDAEYKEGSSAVIRQAIDELEEYFSGQRKRLDVPIRFCRHGFPAMCVECVVGDSVWRNKKLYVDSS